MKKVIMLGLMVVLMVVLSGCSAFDIQYAERINCDGRTTPWANKTEVAADRISWYVNQSGWHSKELSGSSFCVVEPADMERWNKCSGEQHKCKMYPKKKLKIKQHDIPKPKKGVLV